MRGESKILALSVTIGLAGWIIDAYLDYLHFYRGVSFWGLLVYPPAHEVYVRSAWFIALLVLGIIVSRAYTKRKHAEEALRESERRYRALVEKGLVGVYQTTLEGEMLYVNRALATMMGFESAEEMCDRRVTDFYAHLDRRREFLAQLKAKGWVSGFEIDARTKQGEPRTVLVSATLEDERVEGMLMDITGRKQAEEALRESEERYRLLVQNSPDCIKLLDLEGCYLSINRAGIEALGRPLEEILGTSYAGDFDPADQPGVRQAIRKAAGGEVANAEARAAPGAPQAIIWFITLVPLRDPKGRVERLLGVSRDITKRKQAEEAVRRGKEEVERLSRLKDEFLSMASHELKTPITSIKLYSELARKAPETEPARVPGMLVTIDRQADQLVSLINDLLDVSRLQLGKVSLELEPSDLRGLLAEICGWSRQLYADHPLECPAPPQPVLVQADRSRLIQVLQNLIDNAAKYSPAGSPINISVALAADRVTIAVCDRGAGIAPEDLPHIFERFYKPKRLQAVVPGLGLGLYISKEIVDRHGGRIWAESEVGKGSTFYVELPLADQSIME